MAGVHETWINSHQSTKLLSPWMLHFARDTVHTSIIFRLLIPLISNEHWKGNTKQLTRTADAIRVWRRNRFFHAPCLLGPTRHFCMFCHSWLTLSEMAKCFLPRLSSTQEHRRVTRVKDSDIENYLQEAFPGGLCLCVSSEPLSALALHTRQWPTVGSAPGMAAESSAKTPNKPSSWNQYLC